MNKFFPDSLAGRTLLVLLVGLIGSHILATGIHSVERAEAFRLHETMRFADRIAAGVRLVTGAAPGERSRVIAQLSEPGFRARYVDDDDTAAAPATEESDHLLEDILRIRLADLPLREVRVASLPTGDGRPAVLIESLGDGAASPHDATLVVRLRDRLAPLRQAGVVTASVGILDQPGRLEFSASLTETSSFASLKFGLSMTVMIAAVVGLSIWATRQLVGPLSGFARVAERLGKDVHAPPISEKGPREIREAAHAFNQMQERLLQLIENRTRMLAAISHDLRTPIALLRLRAEFIEDAGEQNKTMETLDEMEAMISSILAFARDDSTVEKMRMVDLAALIDSLCDDMMEAGHDVAFDLSGKVLYSCRPVAVKRAIGNLVQNAIRYGRRAAVSIEEDEQTITVTIDDDGPGIPEAEIANVFAPFYRLDKSRGGRSGSIGLGLSIAQSIVDAHGGEIRLANRAEGGLRARVVLPK